MEQKWQSSMLQQVDTVFIAHLFVTTLQGTVVFVLIAAKPTRHLYDTYKVCNSKGLTILCWCMRVQICEAHEENAIIISINFG